MMTKAPPVGLARDEFFMRRCLQLAARAEGRTAPNPIVGCVIVDRRGKVVAEAYHRRAGQPHAEALALAKLGARAKGATMYVSLEPCNHTKARRTKPCVPAIIASGIARVVYGVGDPIASHAGGGRALRKAGIAVTKNVLAEECAAANAPFFTWAMLHRPYVLLKAGISLDGRVATATGESKWITGAAARADGHGLRNRLDAILVGVGTVLADDPALTTRDVRGGRDPIRVVVDSRLRTPTNATLLPRNGGSDARTIIATVRGPHSRPTSARVRSLQARGAEIWALPRAKTGVDLRVLLETLAVAADVRSVLVEGGASIHGSLLAAKLVDRVRLYVAPVVLGSGPAWANAVPAPTLAAAPRLGTPRLVAHVGSDVVLEIDVASD